MTSLPLWLTAEQTCSYFDDRLAKSIVVHPDFAMNTLLYSRLLEQGFRRSGDQVYKPHCPGCSECVPTRIPVATFQPDRRQRRCIKRNHNTKVVIKPAKYDARHFELYRQYQINRHDKSRIADITPDNYIKFLGSSWSDNWFVEFLIGGRLTAVAVVDVLDHALSAVYTFFDPEFNGFSLGSFAVLWQIEEARRRNLDYVYLGFWIKDCRKMRYKIQYQPLQGLIAGQWQAIFNHPIKED